MLHRQSLAQGRPFTAELLAMRQRAIGLVAAVLVRAGGDEGVGEAASVTGESLAAALVGAGESLADWWLDHPEESAATMAARLLNLVWMGFGDLLENAACGETAEEVIGRLSSLSRGGWRGR